MKTNWLEKNGWIRQLTLVRFLMLLLAAFAFTGCETASLNDPADQVSPDQTFSETNQQSQVHSETIILREGDDLKLTFPGSPNLDTTQQIRRDGKLRLDLVGEVDAAGLTLDQLHDKLVKLYASQTSSSEISVTLVSSAFPIYLTGYVLRPGKIMSSQSITAMEAVMEAGVDYTTANLRAVRVIRRENGVSKSYTLNLKKVLDGKDTEPFYLKPEDVVYVPEKLTLF